MSQVPYSKNWGARGEVQAPGPQVQCPLSYISSSASFFCKNAVSSAQPHSAVYCFQLLVPMTLEGSRWAPVCSARVTPSPCSQDLLG